MAHKFNKGEIRIDPENFLRPEVMQGYFTESFIMLKLKEAGAPIRGTVYLRRDEGFDWKYYIDDETYEHVYTWEKL